MMGLESNGMVLAASPDGGQAFVLNSEPAPPGHARSLTSESNGVPCVG